MARELKQTIRIEALDNASSVVSGVETSFAGLTTRSAALTTALGVASAALGALAVVGKKAIDAASEQEEALARLDSALRLKGAEAFGASLRQQADAIQQVTRVSDDAVISAQALIATYGVQGDQIALATQAAVDLAARLGTDLDTAARQVAGTINGFTRGVDKVVPSLKTMSDEALRSGDGIRAIATAMQGGAIDAAETFAGSVDKLKNALGELSEAGGRAVQETGILQHIMESVTPWLYEAANAIDVLSGASAKAATSTALLVAEQETQLRTVTKLSEIQDRATRIMSEYATGQARAAAIAAELGVVLERDVIAKREREAELYKELADLERQGIDVRLAETAALEEAGDAMDGWSASAVQAIQTQQGVIVQLQNVQRQVILTAQAFDYLSRVQGRGAAVDAALASGGRLILGGTRVILPGGGSRLTSPAGFGRFGD